jgi:hypothetical protein
LRVNYPEETTKCPPTHTKLSATLLSVQGRIWPEPASYKPKDAAPGGRQLAQCSRGLRGQSRTSSGSRSAAQREGTHPRPRPGLKGQATAGDAAARFRRSVSDLDAVIARERIQASGENADGRGCREPPELARRGRPRCSRPRGGPSCVQEGVGKESAGFDCLTTERALTYSFTSWFGWPAS